MTMTPEELEKLNQKRSKIVDDLYDLFNSSKENQQRVQESVNQSIIEVIQNSHFNLIQIGSIDTDQK